MLTRSQIDRAGDRLRKSETPREADRLIYDEFRATFAEPRVEIVEALRGLAGDAPVTSRLKRFETTVEKLRRLKSRLSSIEDIAGCRVVLPTMQEQHELLGRIRWELDVVRERNYQAEPRGGYRALHVVVRAQDRLVEVQLRTELEEQWANTVERLAERLDPEIKYSGGPPAVSEVLVLASNILGAFERAEDESPRLRAAIEGTPSDRQRTALIEVQRQYDSAMVTVRTAFSGDLLPLVESAIADPSIRSERAAAVEVATERILRGLNASAHHLQGMRSMIESADA